MTLPLVDNSGVACSNKEKGFAATVESDESLVNSFNISRFTSAQLKKLASTCKNTRSELARDLARQLSSQSEERVKHFFIVGLMRYRHNFAGNVTEKKPLTGWFDLWLLSNLRADLWCSEESVADVVWKPMSEHRMMTCLPSGHEALTPWTRLCKAWSGVDDDLGLGYNRRYASAVTVSFVLPIALALGHQHASKHHEQFVKMAETRKFSGTADWLRSKTNVYHRSLAVYSLRWGWRISWIIGSLTLITQNMQIYRLKDSWYHYPIGVGVPYFFYNWQRGPVGMAAWGLSAAFLVGVPLGILTSLGGNVRSVLYSAFGAPPIDSKEHCSNWSELQREENLLKFQQLTRRLAEVQNHNSADITLAVEPLESS